MATKAFLEKAYLAYFGRPVDPAGLTDFAASTDAQVADAFAASAESKALYGTTFDYAQINAIYLALFNRPAEKAGLEYWYAKVADKTFTAAGAAIAILNGSQNAHKTAIENKLAASAAFSAALDTADEMIGYSGTAAAASARAFLSGVTTTAATAAAVDAAVAAAVASKTAVAGQTFMLTTSADVLNTTTVTAANKTTAGDDIIYATTDGTLTSADIIDAGSGNDAIISNSTSNNQTLAPILTSVETVTITQTAADAKQITFDGSNSAGLTKLNIKNAAAVSADRTGTILGFATTSDELILLKSLSKTTTVGIIGGTASSGTTSADITAQFTSVAAADTQKLEISSAGKVNIVTLQTAETVEITATGNGTTGANSIGSLSAVAVKTLNIKGAGDLTVSASDMAATTAVNASTTTGKITFVAEAGTTSFTFTGGSGDTSLSGSSTGVVNATTGSGSDIIDLSGGASTATVIAGAGNDRVLVGAQANVTAADSINGGDGTDTIVISDATIDGTTKTALATGLTAFELLETTASTATTIDYNALGTYDSVRLSVAMAVSTAGGTNTAGSNSISATMENSDILVISNTRVGQTASTAGAGTNGSASGDAVNIAPRVDGGSNIASINFVGNADIAGGAGQAANGTAKGGLSGDGLDASNIETLNITITGTQAATGTADTVSITAGAAGGTGGTNGTAGDVGSTVKASTNATINITSALEGTTAALHNHLELGTVVSTNVTINGSAFLGNLSVTAATGNTTITGGIGKDTLTGGSGIDTLSGGAGADTLNGMAGADIYTGGLGRDSFAVSNVATTVAGGFDTISDFGKVTTALTATQVGTLSTTNAFGISIAAATTLGGAEADIAIFAATATLAAAATGTNVSAAVTTNPVVLGAITSKGVISVSGAGASLVDTLGEWVAVADLMATANGNVAVFEFSGSTYLYQQTAGATAADTLVQLIGVTGVTGAVVAGTAVAAAANDIFIA